MLHRNPRLGLQVSLLAAALAGCIGVDAVQPVTTEAQAIRVAKDRCTWTRPFQASEAWHARLHSGQWHVWLVRDRDPKEPVVGALDIWIRAKDGDAGSCNRAN
jgi:hypothetical protein